MHRELLNEQEPLFKISRGLDDCKPPPFALRPEGLVVLVLKFRLNDLKDELLAFFGKELSNANAWEQDRDTFLEQCREVALRLPEQ